MRTLQERLKFVMAGPPKISQAALARACHVKAPSVNDWISGKTKSIEGENLLSAAAFLKVLPLWLATGKGPMRDDDDRASRTQKEGDFVLHMATGSGKTHLPIAALKAALEARQQAELLETFAALTLIQQHLLKGDLSKKQADQIRRIRNDLVHGRKQKADDYVVVPERTKGLLESAFRAEESGESSDDLLKMYQLSMEKEFAQEGVGADEPDKSAAGRR
ncbi:DEAD/DEAH box helicase family protein [Pseudomonas sp. YH-1]|uniref:DEAD/DEAH box helicase family protein n=1 Tax=Pseudomonas sp. YH-1 TaxID=3384787 RepID=UPI003F7D73A3